MHQEEIKFFFPLTEQIELDLDFTECDKPKLYYTAGTSGKFLISDGEYRTSWATLNPAFTIDVDQTPITVLSKTNPNFIKRWIYKTMGIKWKIK